MVSKAKASMGGTEMYRANTSMLSKMCGHEACKPQSTERFVATCHKSRRYSRRKLKNWVLSIAKKRDCFANAAIWAIMAL